MTKSLARKIVIIISGLLGICWVIQAYMPDIILLTDGKAWITHIISAVIWAVLIRFTYLKSKKTKRYIQEFHSSRYRMIFDNSPLGIFHFDQNGIIIQSNDRLIEILSATREKIIGFNMLTQLNDENLKLALQSALKGEVGYYEGTYTPVTSGKTLCLKALFNSIFSETGEFLGGVGIYEDVTEKKKIEGEMARLDRLDLVGQMSASIGHEIRNPMTTVRGFLQLLGNQENDPTKKEYYNVMISELDRANTIITEFLSLAKNKLISLELTCLNDIIDSIYPLILVDAVKQDKNILLKKGRIPSIPLDGNEIRQLIFNLVRNGLEAMPKGGGDLTIMTYIAGNELVLAVQDEGSGISSEVMDRIGTPFLTTKETGTGLGLPVCYSIAERHKAKIDIRTGASGTTFYVRFKIANDQVETQKAS